MVVARPGRKPGTRLKGMAGSAQLGVQVIRRESTRNIFVMGVEPGQAQMMDVGEVGSYVCNVGRLTRISSSLSRQARQG